MSGSGSSELDPVTVADNVRADHSASSPSPTVGTLLGRYVVLEEVGRGGMGVVLRGYDPRLQREVALKVVRADSLDAAASSRIVREARAMAKLSHPNVVAIYDVETTESGGVVLAMEYVAGQTLGQWLDGASRSWQEVVECFLRAGRGLVAAHGAGLMHRDFKPANVLVSESGEVKVTDFGLAKSLDQRPPEDGSVLGTTTDVPPESDERESGEWEPGGREPSELLPGLGHDLLTRTGTVVGTPRYMAPEQHLGESLTPAADQYGFCVALFEALTGGPAFQGDTDIEMVRDKYDGPPAWPSGSPVPRRISEAVRRGLASAPGDRWPTMEALIGALTPAPSGRRGRWALSLGAAGVLAAVVVSWQSAAQQCPDAVGHLQGVWDDARRVEVEAAMSATSVSYATEAWSRAQRKLDEYASAWATMRQEVCEATTIRGEQSSEVMDLRNGCLDRARGELSAAVGVLADADDAVMQRAHHIVDGLLPLHRCADVAALAADVEPPLPEQLEVVDSVRARLAEAKARRVAGRFPEARQRVEQARSSLDGLDYPPVIAEVSLEEGLVLTNAGEFESAEVALLDALQRGTRQGRRALTFEVAIELMSLVGYSQQRVDEGLRYRELALGLAEGPGQEAAVHSNIGSLLVIDGKYEQAQAEHRRSLELDAQDPRADPLRTTRLRLALGNALGAGGKYAEAETEHRAALDVLIEALGPSHPSVSRTRHGLGTAMQLQGKLVEARAEFDTVLELEIANYGPEHPHVAASRNNLGNILVGLGESDEAEEQFRGSLATRERVLAPGHAALGESHASLGALLLSKGDLSEAEVHLRRALEIFIEALGEDHPNIAGMHNNLALLAEKAGDVEGAAVEYRLAMEHFERMLDDDHPDLAMTRNNLALVLVELERPDEALPLAERAWERRSREDTPPRFRALTAYVLAKALWGTGQRARARAMAEDSLESYAKAPDNHAAGAAEVRKWIATLGDAE